MYNFANFIKAFCTYHQPYILILFMLFEILCKFGHDTFNLICVIDVIACLRI